jgi:hypothetical protein
VHLGATVGLEGLEEGLGNDGAEIESSGHCLVLNVLGKCARLYSQCLQFNKR